MNAILEQIYLDKDVLSKRRAIGLARLPSRGDVFLEYLHEEMRQCFLNGHDQAALVTSCALIEAAIKRAVYYDTSVKANWEFDGTDWDKIDNMEFGKVINAAKTQGIVEKENWKMLERFRKNIRNYYMHGETPDWVKDVACPIIEGDLTTGEARRVTVKTRENIVLQEYARVAADRNVCDQMVRFVDTAVRDLQSRSDKALREWNEEHPMPKPTLEQVQGMIANMKKLQSFTQGNCQETSEQQDAKYDGCED